MNYFKLFLVLVLLHGAPSCSIAQTSGKQLEANSMLGIDFKNNLVKNPSAYENLNNITGGVGSVFARDTDAADAIDGKASVSFTLEPGETINWDLNTPSSEQEGGNCEFKGLIKVPGSGVTLNVQITDGSNVSLTSALVPSTGSIYRTFSLDYPCGASGTRKVRLINNDGSLTTSGNIGGLYYGLATNIGLGVAQNEFTAKISSTGVVTDQTPFNWLVSCTNAAPTVCTYVTGIFNSIPTCTMNGDLTGTSTPIPIVPTPGASTVTFQTNNASGTAVASRYQVRCNKTGVDVVQPTITPNQWNYGPVLYTPTLGGGFGTTTNVSVTQKREGPYLFVQGSFNVGTTAASLYSITLPSGLIIDTSKITVLNTTANPGVEVGEATCGGANSAFPIVTALGTSTSTIYLGGSYAGSTITTPSAAAGQCSASSLFSFSFKVPISGWTENQNAPQLLGSVTSNAGGALRIESANISAAGVVSGETSDWISGNCTNAVPYVCTIITSTYSSAPFCMAAGTDTAVKFYNVTDITPSGLSVRQFNTSGTGTNDAPFRIMCFGPR